MARGHRSRSGTDKRGRYGLGPSRAWVSPLPTSEQLPRDLVVRRSTVRAPLFSQLEAELRVPLPSVSRASKVSTYSPRVSAKRVVSPRGVIAPSMEKIAFARPDRIWVCVRRKIRREVLHALDLTKRRGSGGGRKRFTEESFISCVKK